MDCQVLAVRGVGGYRQYRIPALACTPSGRLIAVYDGRPDLDDLPGPIDVVLRTSDDNGTTWSPQTVLRKNVDITGYGDASIVVDPTVGEHGRILVFMQSTQLAGFFESPLGSGDDDPTVNHIELSRSDDDGQTWTHHRVTAQLKDDLTPGIFASSGMGGRLAVGPFAGRLLQTFVLRRGAELLGAIGYSDDHGETWSLGALIPGGNESAAIGLDDGSILVHSRLRPHRLSARSLDGGMTLASMAPDLALPDPSDNGSLCALSNGAVVCTHNHDSDLRRRTVVKRSTDGGHTWPEAVVLAAGSSAYSTACELADGRIGVLLERNGYTEMVFCRIDADDFAPTAEVLPSEADRDGIAFTAALRFVRPARTPLAETSAAEGERRLVPTVDMSVFGAAVRKEIGQAGLTFGGEPLYTSDELDAMLGPVSPGLHLDDELRFNGRLANEGPGLLSDIVIENSCGQPAIAQALLSAGDRIVFPDVRYLVTANDLRAGTVSVDFTWRAQLRAPGSSVSRPVGGTVNQSLSTETGLPVTA